MWFVIVVVTISTVFNIISFIGNIVTSSSDWVYILVNLIFTLLGLVYLKDLFLCKKSVFIWTNIFFGLYIILTFVAIGGMVLSLLDPKTIALGGLVSLAFISMLLPILIPLLVLVVIGVVIWVTFYKHLKRSQSSGRIILS